MGICGSSDTKNAPVDQAAKAASKAIENKMAAEHQEEKQVNKLLLLGAGESGKSTLFKQMISIYGKGFPEPERAGYTNIIYNNIITSMKTLCKQSHVCCSVGSPGLDGPIDP